MLTRLSALSIIVFLCVYVLAGSSTSEHSIAILIAVSLDFYYRLFAAPAGRICTCHVMYGAAHITVSPETALFQIMRYVYHKLVVIS